MKSVKQQYIDLKEGKMTQAQFMRNVRMSLPEYITNVTSFSDTVKILRNKAILTEADIKSPITINGKIVRTYTQNGDKSYTVNYDNGDTETIMVSNDGWDSIDTLRKNATGMNEADIKLQFNDIKSGDILRNKFSGTKYTVTNVTGNTADIQQGDDGKEMEIATLNNYELFKDKMDEADIYGIAGDPEAEAERKSAGMGIKPMQTPEDKYGVDKRIDQSELNFLKKIYAKNPTESIKQMIDDLEQRMSLNESYTTNTSGKELYSRFSEIDNLNGQEVLIGIDYEIEKNGGLTKKEAAKIVVKNLKKNQFYYTDTLMSGVEGYKTQYMNKFKPGSDQMRDVKSNDLVDKTNGMTSPKGIEKVKASSNKAHKETNKPEGTIKMMSLVAKTVRGVKKMDATGEKMKKLTLKESARMSDDIIDLADKIYKELEAMGTTDSDTKQDLINIHAPDLEGNDLRDLNILLFQKSAREIHEYSRLPGGDNMTDTAGHQMDEAKASSLSVGDKFKISADLGKFTMGEEVEVISVEPFGNDIKLVLSNGTDEDDFYLDRNDEI